MSRPNVLAKRYAKAFRLMFTNTDEASKNEKAFEQLISVIESSKELKSLVASGGFAFAEKVKVLASICDKIETPKELKDFVSKVIELGRGEILHLIYNVYAKQLRLEQGLMELKVESALELSSEQEQKLKLDLENVTGKKFIMSSSVNPQLLAGVKIEMMGKTLDGSLRTLLNSMKEGILREQSEHA